MITKNPSKKQRQQKDKVGQYGKFYVARINKGGRRFTDDHIETETAAIEIAEAKEGGGIHTHAYAFRDGKYEKIYPKPKSS